MGAHQFTLRQELPVQLDELWAFISSPHNLQKITPPDMDFKVVTQDLPLNMYPGMIIKYHVRPIWGLRTTWVTEITHVKELQYFVDEQRSGPYRMWHHEHRLVPNSNGVEMVDTITYIPPFGIIGILANRFLIKRKLEKIFKYRRMVLEGMFGAS
ncbi:MAG: SRPBCC family protein [Bacteroidia bacterium]